MEEIPSLLNTAFKQIAAIAEAVSEVAKTDSYTRNPDVFSEEDFISGEDPTTGSETMKWIALVPSDESLTPVMKGMTLAPEESVAAAEESLLL
jgi:hypothetical protein